MGQNRQLQGTFYPVHVAMVGHCSTLRLARWRTQVPFRHDWNTQASLAIMTHNNMVATASVWTVHDKVGGRGGPPETSMRSEHVGNEWLWHLAGAISP
jgi:hypothetical protein